MHRPSFHFAASEFCLRQRAPRAITQIQPHGPSALCKLPHSLLPLLHLSQVFFLYSNIARHGHCIGCTFTTHTPFGRPVAKAYLRLGLTQSVHEEAHANDSAERCLAGAEGPRSRESMDEGVGRKSQGEDDWYVDNITTRSCRRSDRKS